MQVHISHAWFLNHGLYIWKQTVAVSRGESGWDDDAAALATLYTAFNICCGVWIVWFLFLFRRSYRRLRALPYLATRTRQLSFHFFSLNATFVIGFVLAAYLYQTLRPPSALALDDYVAPDPQCLLCTVRVVLLLTNRANLVICHPP